MAARKTCDKCRHYAPGEPAWSTDLRTNNGSCAVMGDVNRMADRETPADQCRGWDYESFKAGVYVGPKFGCIHWVPIVTVLED